MDDLLAARSTMAFSLGFHIIFAAIGMVMPFMMAMAHFLYLKKNRQEDLELTKLWMKGVAILFAVGAVSGTVLSFELGLLWPGFMKHAGPIIGMPFSWEGTAFFLEAIAIGLFLYGWNRMNKWVHWFAGFVVGLSGFASGIFVVAANSWMNTPAGFDWVNGQAVNIDPVAAMFNKAWLHQTMHMQVAAIQAVGFAVAGLHALLLLKGSHSALHARALKIAMVFATVASLIQPMVGHFAAQKVAEYQPVKLAAMEAHFKTEARAPIILGGIPDVETGEVHGAIKIPGVLSFLAFNDFNATVKGLHDFPREEWPPVLIVHIAFQIMVGLGSLMIVLGLVYIFLARRGGLPKWFLKVLVVSTPLGFIAIEAGWVVTEVGRQPWIVYGIMKTKDAVTPMPGVQFHFYLFVALYLFLSFVTAWLFRRQVQVAENNMHKGAVK
ncbi:cytochrome ubiquinol oxidase subunit I [Bdellovibrio sp. SKB1291214]|uniref:cytochrome ubiquinol oxidase subunit I n=1 Tax=Bdellovibrio sp. SKB1291214 TaxID=1732569 RepID=UPI000B515600|nr:cytochrome ubiquinol oxidase subunit I [Bdellovibrio sp. SKB1291214]UYL07343.1 cytochrome ubiquinol oxidase subunit I [Bdellovibrio sp. SKB1291214]